MNNEVYLVPKDELYHYGVKGMKWGHRKNIYDVNANYYNNRAAKLTAKANRNRTMASMNRAGARAANTNRVIAAMNRSNAKYYENRANKLQAKADKNKNMARLNEAASKSRNEPKKQLTSEQQAAKRKKALKAGTAAAGVALAAYGTYKYSKYVESQTKAMQAGRRAMEEQLRLARSTAGYTSRMVPR